MEEGLGGFTAQPGVIVKFQVCHEISVKFKVFYSSEVWCWFLLGNQSNLRNLPKKAN